MEQNKQAGNQPQETSSQNVGKSQEQVQEKSTQGKQILGGSEGRPEKQGTTQEDSFRRGDARDLQGRQSEGDADVAQERTRESGE